jgi:aminomethyltransferase
MGEEGGWALPLHYGDPLAEAEAVRRRAGVFDVSHLGRIRVRGDGALDLLERVCTADVARQEDETTLHSLLCNEAGGILDECFLLRLPAFWVLTTTACNREKIFAHLLAQEVPGAKVDDQTQKVCQVAVAGPTAEEILSAVLPIPVAGLGRGDAKVGSLMIANYIAVRTGYSDLWSLEVMIPNLFAGRAWSFITSTAGENAVAPAGATARDILRIEAGLCRYGHEISEAVDPITAGLGDCVDFGHDFIGAEAIRKITEKGPARKRVRLEFEEETTRNGKPWGSESGDRESGAEGGAIPRMGAPVFDAEGREAGAITSATFSPAANRILAQAYVAADAAADGGAVAVGEKRQPAQLTGVCG